MIEPDEEGNLTPSAPLGPPLLALFTLDGPLALMPGPPPDPSPREVVDTSALARAIEFAVSRAVAEAEVVAVPRADPGPASDPVVAFEPEPAPVAVAPEPAPVAPVTPVTPVVAIAARPLVATAYTRPHRARSVLELVLISVVLGTVLAAAIGLAAAVVVAVVNHAVSSSSTAP
ncbi:MAG TPA: hypothetical protein VNY84_13800 [Acidimicrobiales bacterium]|nr:hypothetical protein [Acidimicrobiales bacterium]